MIQYLGFPQQHKQRFVAAAACAEDSKLPVDDLQPFEVIIDPGPEFPFFGMFGR